MSPFLLGPEIIGEDVFKLPISNNDLILEQKTNDTLSSPSVVNEVSFDILSKKLVGQALQAHIDSVDLDTCPPGGEDSFFVADLGRVYHQYKRWVANLPRIEPFYAVKCNNDPQVLKLMVAMGLGFDCASKNEIDMMLAQGVDPARIVYAHPCKAASYIRHAKTVGVEHMTFDNADELRKCKKAFPNCKLLLRIATDDSKSLCQFSIKYGASMEAAHDLLDLAKKLQLDVVGVSFHVGSGASDPSAFVGAVQNARTLFDYAESIGMPPMSILDVGGGFVHETFEQTAVVLGSCIDEIFPRDASTPVRVIAEPGRYFVSSAFTLAVNVVGRRVTMKDEVERLMLYINDGVYANMNSIIFDHQEPVPKILSKAKIFMYSEVSDYDNDDASSACTSCQSTSECTSDCSSVVSSSSLSVSSADEVEVSIWGPTCDGIDVITKSSFLPVSVDIGDWLYFTDFGAYTLSAAGTFNGFNTDCHVEYIYSEPIVKKYLGI
ncbi:uncharacterized protein SAPINGB_P003551 [Magnusiomyces paraingens]|uniref:ornithine decarboxylase n=1 Tax=Magnusiomyces paraingens TaxID=2606893 RepID=A0A5E8BPW7_9ASCO|nr:uncharacterized protein SAPINGB_P003551 [Saprochaete ingens]VVT53393.1 unnamed protein product [Saprochaete ingens]